MQTLPVDFNTMMQFEDNDHVIIAQTDHSRDKNVHLKNGERVIVYDEEFQVEAVAHLENNFWIGEIDWTTKKGV
jgi:hypothetical protein